MAVIKEPNQMSPSMRPEKENIISVNTKSGQLELAVTRCRLFLYQEDCEEAPKSTKKLYRGCWMKTTS
ncbi:hypothetical protein LDENG_00008510 [Lucifuga dentata]|nr:hypothetical protein LDENG_00008510 [Lucifuga dentata]